MEKAASLGKVEIIGKTGLGREIPLVRIGNDPKVLLVAGIHGREHITTDLLFELLATEADGLSVDCIPSLNIDGACLCKEGTDSVGNVFLRRTLLSYNGGKTDFSQWKANAYGVDINVNFDADWGEGRSNVFSPAPSDYVGKSPESESETRAAVNVLKRGYALVVCYHSLGEEVYWGYESNFRFYLEAKKYADYVGYRLRRSEYSCGGLKDYYSLNYGGLGLTVEIGDEKYGHPYPVEKLGLITAKHRGSLKLLCGLGEDISGRIHAGSVVGGAKSL